MNNPEPADAVDSIAVNHIGLTRLSDSRQGIHSTWRCLAMGWGRNRWSLGSHVCWCHLFGVCHHHRCRSRRGNWVRLPTQTDRCIPNWRECQSPQLKWRCLQTSTDFLPNRWKWQCWRYCMDEIKSHESSSQSPKLVFDAESAKSQVAMCCASMMSMICFVTPTTWLIAKFTVKLTCRRGPQMCGWRWCCCRCGGWSRWTWDPKTSSKLWGYSGQESSQVNSSVLKWATQDSIAAPKKDADEAKMKSYNRRD